MKPRLSPSLARTRLPAGPVAVVAMVVAVPALLGVPMLQGLGALALEPLLAFVAVFAGLLAVAVCLQMLDVRDQHRANVLVLGLSVAAVCNFMHAMLQLQAGAPQAGQAAAGAFFSMAARGVEALTLLLFALRLHIPGAGMVWVAVAALAAMPLLWTGAGPLSAGWMQEQGGVRLLLASLAAAVAMAAAAGLLLRPGGPERGGRVRLMAWAALCMAAGEAMLGVRVWLGDEALPLGWAAHALRVAGYALLFQAVYTSGVRLPYERARQAERRVRESGLRLQSLGRNLPGSVLYQLVREPDGRRYFVHVGDAILRLNGVRADDVVRDAAVLYDQILPEDRPLNALAEEQSFHTMCVSECVVRMRRTDGEVRWMRMSSSPRRLDAGRVIWDGVLSDVTQQREAERLTRERDVQLASVLQHLPGGVSRVDRQGRVLYVNPLQAQWLRCAPSALEGQLLSDVLTQPFLSRLDPPLQRALRGETTTAEVDMEGPDGPVVWRITFVPERAGEEVSSVVIFAYDITEQKRLAHELRQQRTQLAGLVNAIPDVVSLKDAQGRYVSGNPVFARFLGRSEREFVGLTDAQLLPAGEAQRVQALDQRAMAAWQPLVVEETLTFAEDGYSGRFETVKTPIRDQHGRVTGVLSVCRDITDRQRAAQEIERLAFYDPLTGLPNRRLLLDRLEHAMAACERHGRLGALLFIDLDNFKDLNDTLGHDMGDRLLAQVAQRLVECVRESDTVARFGGDEFVVMLENLEPALSRAAGQAERVSEKLLARLNQPFDLGSQQYFSTLSIGITLFGEQRSSVDELLKRADLAMYQAKAAGRNTQRFFDPDMQAAVNARSQLEADLRQGLARSELSVHFQPVMDERARLCGAEALVRWRHPERGMVSPAEFIPLAEQTGLIVPLGRMVLRLACEQLVRWSHPASTRGLSISVNVSARQFRQPDFVADVLGTLAETGAQAGLLKLELTESLLLGDVEDTAQRMGLLQQQGVGFALDDFGTGYSSLSYLKRLPLAQIKIDQGFVRDVLADPNDAAIVRTILALAKSMDLQVVAEGVESTSQLAFLKLHGCDGFQGYLFGRPCTAEQFEAEHLPELGPHSQALATPALP
jgi:diguanylate cyclase (GGDEF)-like protein/PAS domain S-box-containing protein